jgi:hypothetical protein
VTTFTVTNEFAEVTVSLVRYGNGHRVEVRSERWGTAIWLDAVELEALTWQPTAHFSAMLEESVRP